MKDKVLKSYYIGEPGHDNGKPQRRGQDDIGYVHCIEWFLIYAPGYDRNHPKLFTVGHGGSVVGHAKTVADCRTIIHGMALADLQRRIAVAEAEIRRCKAALKSLDDDPANLEKFDGPYSDDTPLTRSLR
jgi:hypothetical protein